MIETSHSTKLIMEQEFDFSSKLKYIIIKLAGQTLLFQIILKMALTADRSVVRSLCATGPVWIFFLIFRFFLK